MAGNIENARIVKLSFFEVVRIHAPAGNLDTADRVKRQIRAFHNAGRGLLRVPIWLRKNKSVPARVHAFTRAAHAPPHRD